VKLDTVSNDYLMRPNRPQRIPFTTPLHQPTTATVTRRIEISGAAAEIM